MTPTPLAGSISVTPCSLEALADAPVFLQTPLWGSFKSRFGWEAHGFRVKAMGEDFPLLVLLRKVRSGMVLAYVPHGPAGKAFEPLGNSLATGDQPSSDTHTLTQRLAELSRQLRHHLGPEVFALRWDLLSGWIEKAIEPEDETSLEQANPPTAVQSKGPATALGAPFRKPSADVQPPDTVLVDLTASEGVILARMKKKTRYNVRLAEKKGVSVVQGDVQDLKNWYELYKQTGARDKIAIHPLDYYLTLFEMARDLPSGPQVYLLLAQIELTGPSKITLAGNLVVTYRGQGVYLYGASSNEYRNLMAPYLLQWEGIKLAKAAGCTVYDLFGIPPTNVPSHPMHGLYQFKTGWGGWIEHRHGAWDVVWKPLTWGLINSLERIRVWYYKVWKKLF